MVEMWFAIVAVMLTAFVVLDGFDFGAGALHLIVARTDDERRRVLGAIGPYWDGHEVWLLASGGALLVAFPKALASGLSPRMRARFCGEPAEVLISSLMPSRLRSSRYCCA